ncbi:unnamed protein product [Amoebophrya sp. A120]|nr:unnamed protein product [Amoebophrya sp. A120]|eukprot:GSA120T00022941001.1
MMRFDFVASPHLMRFPFPKQHVRATSRWSLVCFWRSTAFRASRPETSEMTGTTPSDEVSGCKAGANGKSFLHAASRSPRRGQPTGKSDRAASERPFREKVSGQEVLTSLFRGYWDLKRQELRASTSVAVAALYHTRAFVLGRTEFAPQEPAMPALELHTARGQYCNLVWHLRRKVRRGALNADQLVTTLTAVLRQPVRVVKPLAADALRELTKTWCAADVNLLKPAQAACCLNTIVALGLRGDEFVQRCEQLFRAHYYSGKITGEPLLPSGDDPENMNPPSLSQVQPRHLVQLLSAAASMRPSSLLPQSELAKLHPSFGYDKQARTEHWVVDAVAAVLTRRCAGSDLKLREYVDCAYALMLAENTTADGAPSIATDHHSGRTRTSQLHEQLRSRILESATPIVVHAAKRLLSDRWSAVDDDFFIGDIANFPDATLSPATSAGHENPHHNLQKESGAAAGDAGAGGSAAVLSMADFLRRELGMLQHDRFRTVVAFYGLNDSLPGEFREVLEQTAACGPRTHTSVRRELSESANFASLKPRRPRESPHGSRALGFSVFAHDECDWDEVAAVEQHLREVADSSSMNVCSTLPATAAQHS